MIGWPIGHSRSPIVHRHWLKHYRIKGSYDAFAVPPETLEEFITNLAERGFCGINVTLPHKERVFQLMDRIEPEARRIKAVNTVVVGASDELIGNNTDGFGFLENLRTAVPDFGADQGSAVVLGAGGAAKAIVAALLDADCPEIRLCNRSRKRAEMLALDLGGATRVIDWAERSGALEGVGLLVNTTSLGMTGQPHLELNLSALPLSAVVNDIVYRPLVTELLAVAAAKGNRVVDGLGMLLHQARPGFAAWFGVEPEVTPELRQAVLAGIP